MSTKEADLLFRARMAEQCERYENMKDSMKALAETKGKLGQEERNLLSVGYKNFIGARRASYRVAWSIRNTKELDEHEKKIAEEFIGTIKKEMDDLIGEVTEVLTNLLKPTDLSVEEKVFYLKMKGDYFRYKCEYRDGPGVQSEAEASYTEAFELASHPTKGLPYTNPILLGLALNMSVFFNETCGDVKKAIKYAKTAFDKAISVLDKLDEADYKDATLIMQLLRDNLTLWSSEGLPE